MKGVSPLIAFVITVFLSFVAITLAMKVIMPTLNRAKAYSVTNEAIQNLKLLDSAIQEVASEAPGSKRTIELKISDGIYRIDKNSNTIYFDYTPDANIPIMGKMGNLWIEKGLVFSEWFGSDDSLSNWNQISGSWQITNGELEGGNGAIYRQVGKTTNDFYFCGFVQNKNGKGEIYLTSVNPTNLVEFLSLDEGSGSNVCDYSGHQNNGTLKDANTTNDDGDTPPKWVDGVYGKALQFDGVDDYVDVPDSDNLEPTDITISLWIKPTSWNQDSIAISLIAKRTSTDSGYFLFVNSSSGTLEFDWGGSSERWSTGYTPPLNKWTMITITRNSSLRVLYVNGNFYSSSADVGNSSNVPTSSDLVIGKNSFDNKYFFNGTIDEVRIYDKALTPKEVKNFYEIGKKKIESINCTNKISSDFSPYIVISNPCGTSYFDNIRIERRGEKNMKIVLPYGNVEFYSNNRIPKGVQMVSIENIGYNDTTDKPIIKVSIE